MTNTATDSLSLHTIDGVELRLPIAGVGARSYAFVIDWHIRALAAAIWAIGGLVALRYFGLRGREFGFMQFGVALPTALIYFGYHPLLETVQGGLTPGKRMAGLRIVAQNGGVPSVGALLIRNIFRMIDSLPVCYGLALVMMLMSSRQSRLGDLAAGTLVVFDATAKKKLLSTDALLSNDRVSPQVLLLADELLQRWPELLPEQRAVLGRRLLERAGHAVVPSNDEDLRVAVQALHGGRR